MNIAKNMEAIVIAVIAVAVAAASSMATAAVPKFHAAQPVAEAVTTHVVYVSAKRLSAEEKAAL